MRRWTISIPSKLLASCQYALNVLLRFALLVSLSPPFPCVLIVIAQLLSRYLYSPRACGGLSRLTHPSQRCPLHGLLFLSLARAPAPFTQLPRTIHYACTHPASTQSASFAFALPLFYMPTDANAAAGPSGQQSPSPRAPPLPPSGSSPLPPSNASSAGVSPFDLQALAAALSPFFFSQLQVTRRRGPGGSPAPAASRATSATSASRGSSAAVAPAQYRPPVAAVLWSRRPPHG